MVWLEARRFSSFRKSGMSWRRGILAAGLRPDFWSAVWKATSCRFVFVRLAMARASTVAHQVAHGGKFMDRVYLANIPKYKTMLAKLKSEFSALTTTTDWVKLRVEPLLAHVESLDQLLRSPRFSSEIARLRKGV